MKYMEKMKIIYEDSAVLVCFKPAGLPVQSAGLRTQDLEHQLLSYLSAEETVSAKNGETGLFVVHRLDQPVQGLAVFAKTAGAAAELNRQNQGQEMKKEYLALVYPEADAAGQSSCGEEGRLPGAVMQLEDWLLRDGRTNRSTVVPAGTRGAKKARLSFTDVTGDPAYDGGGNREISMVSRLMKIRLYTGRHHQIRVQLSHAGFPIIGDRKYGDDTSSLLRFPALCAYHLSFTHPRTGERMDFALKAEEIRFR